ncbi:hypothetical protein [Bowmanella dokdonensis]|nr:hypothetical protein [Bowmanella dokdonensis]
MNKLFQRQQPKVGARPGTGRLLRSFAEDDCKRIALLIQTWLEADERRQHKPLVRGRVK